MLTRILTLVFLGFVLHTPAALALSDAQAMNLSGMQRMLSQRIAKSYLMIGLEVRPDIANQQLDESIATFESNHQALMGYAPNQTIRKELDVANTQWQAYRQLVLATPDRQRALQVMAQSDQLLAQCEQVVKLVEVHTGDRTATLVNKSGRQRMLSQRIAKLYLAMSWHLPIAELDSQFNQAVGDFEAALRNLQAAEQNTPAITESLDKADVQWNFMRAGFELSADARYVPTIITLSTDSLLRQMNELTTAYEQVMRQTEAAPAS